MNGGDTDTGGAQVNSNTIPTNTSSAQSAGPVDPNKGDASMLPISHNQPGADIVSQPAQQSVVQPGESATMVEQTFSTPSTTVTANSSPNATSAATRIFIQSSIYASQPAPNPIPQPQSESQLMSQTFTSGSPSSQPNLNTPSYQYQQQPTAQFSARVMPLNNDNIILNTSPQRKNRKKWIVSGILAVFCAAIVGAILFINFRSNEGISASNLDKINEEISKFSSTIIYGDERQVDLSTLNYNDFVDYKFAHEIRDGNREYIDLVIDEFNSLNNLIIENGSLNLTDDYRYYLEIYRNKLQFFKVYVDSLNEDSSTIISELIDGGKDAAVSYIETQYGEYIDSNIISLRNYFLYKIEYEKLYINVLSQTNINECVDDSTVTNCGVDSLMTNEEISQMQEIEKEMETIVNTNIKYVINGCWVIYNMINGVSND